MNQLTFKNNNNIKDRKIFLSMFSSFKTNSKYLKTSYEKKIPL